MFREAIAKQCDNRECTLHGQMLDAGLAICPECGGELTPVTRLKYRLIAAVAGLALMGVGSGSALAYGMAVEQLGPVQTVCWLMGKCTLPDGLAVPASRGQWFRGSIQWSFRAEHEPKSFSRQSLCEARGSAYWCQPRFTSANGDRFHFELSPEARYLYVLYRHPLKSMRLYPSGTAAAQAGTAAAQPEGATVEVPVGAEVELAGPATSELFAIVSSKTALPEVAGLPQEGFPGERLDRALAPLAGSGECVVMWVRIPHQ